MPPVLPVLNLKGSMKNDEGLMRITASFEPQQLLASVHPERLPSSNSKNSIQGGANLNKLKKGTEGSILKIDLDKVQQRNQNRNHLSKVDARMTSSLGHQRPANPNLTLGCE